MSRLSEFERAAEALRRLANQIARELRLGLDADFPLLTRLAIDLARQADRLATAMTDFDAVLGSALRSRSLATNGDLLEALSPSWRRTAGGN